MSGMKTEKEDLIIHLDDAVQGVQAPLKRLTEHRDVFTQLGGSSLTEDRPPAFVQLHQVHRRVPLLPLQLVLVSNTQTQKILICFWF